MKSGKQIIIAAAVLLQGITFQLQLPAQSGKTLTLENAVELALKKNHLMNIKKLQAEEKQQKINEDKVKYLPTIIIGGSYQYNSSLPRLVLEQGQFGSLPYGGIQIPLPAKNEVIQMGNHNIYNAGITIYQPISQLGKINAGVRVSKTELKVVQAEQLKAVQQIRQSVEKLFYGLLITGKQIEEANIKVALATSKLRDIGNAVSAGKTTESNRYGLAAAVADEEQNLLKLKIQYDDYAADLKQLAGIEPAIEIIPEPVSREEIVSELAPADTSLVKAESNNNDIKLASLAISRAGNSIRANQFGYLPEVGILGGYTYQKGSVIYPKNNTFVGASVKWNLQDLLSNKTIQGQRTWLKKQAEENLANTREQVAKDVAKAYRKLKQTQELIKVATKVVDYRREDLKIQSDMYASGLNLESDMLAAKAAMAKAESDQYAAQLNYRIALSELKILTGSY
ncbi:MAG: TolC family protein [Bacteroidota bacterium]|nr:TolC family protein [Bacteroidota bacterium]